GAGRLQVLHGIAVEPALAHEEAVEPPHAVDDAGHRARGEPFPAQGLHERREVRLLEPLEALPAPLRVGLEAREVVAVGFDRARGKSALDAGVVEVLAGEAALLRRGLQKLNSPPNRNPDMCTSSESRSSCPSMLRRR